MPWDDFTSLSAVTFHELPVLINHEANAIHATAQIQSLGPRDQAPASESQFLPPDPDGHGFRVGRKDLPVQEGLMHWQRRSRSVGRGPSLQPFSRPLWSSVKRRTLEPRWKSEDNKVSLRKYPLSSSGPVPKPG
jgi:hypothetical protein